ncbi:MAG: hypothetical protein ACK5LL_08115 [Suipraeoptans sp.]
MKKILKYQINNHKMTILIFTIVSIFLYSFSNFTFVFNGNSTVSFNGIEMMGLIICFILFVGDYGETFRFSIQNGVTRKNTYFSSILLALILSFLFSLISLIINIIFSLILGLSDVLYLSMTTLIFGTNVSVFIGMLQSFVYTFTMILVGSMFGILLATMFARAGRIGRVLIAAGVPITLFVGFPVIGSNLYNIAPTFVNRISDFVLYIMGYQTNNPFLGSFTMIICAAILGIIAFFINRKIEVK